MKCIPMSGDIDFTVPALVSKNMQASFVVSSEPNTPNPALITYSWSAPDFSPVTQDGKTFTATAPEIAGTYPVILTAKSERYCDLAITKDVVIQECAPPGAMGITFAEFNPCAGTPYGSTYTLTDDRDQKTYMVKYMPDGRYWMVQDLKFGDKCKNLSFNVTSSNRLDGVNSSGTYYGICSAATTTVTADKAGYYYDWAAVMNKPDVYTATTDIGCSGTLTGTSGHNPGACQGICPVGWHVPTASNGGEYDALIALIGNCLAATSTCSGTNAFYPSNGDSLNAVGSFMNPGKYFNMHSSTWVGTGQHWFVIDTSVANHCCHQYGRQIRCVMNY
jgi:uncharacterized protein (TIGR02145 family)